MKVLVAWPELLPKNHAGAVRGWAYVKAIAALGWEPVIVTSKRSLKGTGPEVAEGVHFLSLYESYVGRFPVPFRPFLAPLTVNRLRRLARKSGIEAVLTSTPGLFLAAEAFAVSRLLRVGFYLDVRDPWALEEVYLPKGFRSQSKRWLERTMCLGADRVFTVTESSARLLIETHRISAEKVVTVPNVADLSIFRPNGSSKAVDLVFAGSPAPYRDLPRLMSAIQELAQMLPSLRVRWVGWRTPQLEAETERIINDLTSRGILELGPSVAHEEIPKILNEARIGIVSLTQHELFRTAIGAKTFEYLACGLPIICLGPAGESELGRLVESSDVGAYTSTSHEFAIEAKRILSDQTLLERLAGNSLRAASRYDRGEVTRRALSDALGSWERQEEVAR